MSTPRPIAFTRGVPPVEAFPVAEVADCAATILRADPNILLQYGKAAGYLPLRQWLAQKHGLDVEQVFLSNGSLQLMEFLSSTLLSAGDTVFVESPSYDRAIITFRRHQAEVVGIPLEADGVDLDALEKAIARHKPRLFYIIPDFQNPAGVTMAAAKRRRVAELARQHGFWIVEDVPYRSLRYYGDDEPTLQSMAPDRTLQLSSFSKLLSPGMRTGYMLAPTEVVARVARIAEDTYITPALPTQGIIYEYCRRGLLDRNIAHLHDLYRPKLDATLRALASEVPEAQWAEPQGGYFVGVNMPGSLDRAALTARAKEQNLVLTDGDGFFVEPPAKTFVRIPFCSVSVGDIGEGIARLGKIVKGAI
ncbi:MAG: aminotransferase-like domain-containing protein [Chloroflexota bacterium]